MGVYIDMEMPKSRPVCIAIDAAGQARRYDLNNDRYADDKLFEAVPVPPHGRLIDADATEIYKREELAFARYNENQDDEFLEGIKDGWHEAAKCLSCAPTIIPAEEGEP